MSENTELRRLRDGLHALATGWVSNGDSHYYGRAVQTLLNGPPAPAHANHGVIETIARELWAQDYAHPWDSAPEADRASYRSCATALADALSKNANLAEAFAKRLFALTYDPDLWDVADERTRANFIAQAFNALGALA